MTDLENLQRRIRETEEVLDLAKKKLEEQPDLPSAQMRYNSLRIQYDRFLEELAAYGEGKARRQG